MGRQLSSDEFEKTDLLLHVEQLNVAYPRCENLTTDVTKRSASVSGKSMDH